MYFKKTVFIFIVIFFIGCNEDVFDLEIQNNDLNSSISISLKQTSFTELPSDNKFSDIVSTTGHTLILKDDKTLWGCGKGSSGELGLGTDDKSVLSLIAGSFRWDKIAASSEVSYAIRDDGTLWVWGSEVVLASQREGNLGLGDSINVATTPSQIGSKNTWVDISKLSTSSTLGILSDGTLWGWGRNYSGVLASADLTLIHTSPVQIGTDTNWSKIVTPDKMALGLRTDGTLWSWGEGEFGSLGQGGTADVYIPTQIGTDNNWSAIFASSDALPLISVFAMKVDGSLYAWGYNSLGTLGVGDYLDRAAPTILLGGTWKSIAVGRTHVIGLKADGTIWTWGDNEKLQLGNDSNTSTIRSQPVQLGTDTDWVAVKAGSQSSFAIKKDGTYRAWGDNTLSKLCIDSQESQVFGPDIASVWVKKVSNNTFSLALDSLSELWSWGRNTNGQLGLGDTTNRETKTKTSLNKSWKDIALGKSHSLAIASDGTLWSWGNNDRGQLGDGSNTQQVNPVLIDSDQQWSQVSAGDSHSIALKTDGSLWTWGDNSYGQLGLDSLSLDPMVSKLTQVGTSTQWIAIKAYENTTYVKKSDGSIWSAGKVLTENEIN